MKSRTGPELKQVVVLFVSSVLVLLITCTISAQENPCGLRWKTKDPPDFKTMERAAIKAKKALLRAKINGIVSVDVLHGGIKIQLTANSWDVSLERKCILLKNIMETAMSSNGNTGIPIDVYISGTIWRTATSIHDTKLGDFFMLLDIEFQKRLEKRIEKQLEQEGW